MDKFFAYSVHALTASGAFWALLALVSAARGDWVAMFGWLGMAFIVDGIDGPLARKFSVSSLLPRWSGASLDFVIDYATYVFVPAFALYWSGILEGLSALFGAGIIAVSGAVYFADTGMKTEGNFFSGFPAAWNGVVFIFFVFPFAPWLTISIIILFAILSFLPCWFIHPVRVKTWRPLTLGITFIWSILALWTLFSNLQPPNAILWGLGLASVYLFSIGFILQFKQRFLIN